MWCLVNLPNKATIAVQCDLTKAIGQECLEKVCHDLGIICETDYFGLLYSPTTSSCTTSSLPNEKQWINLRNPLQRRHSNDRTLMLELRVKFWVPGHLILQESVRDAFHMQARQMLLDGELFANDWPNAAKLSALLAQADGVKFSPCCLKENYRELNDVLQKLKEEKENELKQNKRRRISKRKSSESELQSQRSSANAQEVIEEETTSNNNQYGSLKNYLNYIVRPQFESEADNENEEQKMPDDFLIMIAKEHEKMSVQHMTVASAKYWLLEEIAMLKKFGEEMFEGILATTDSIGNQTKNQHQTILIGVSPNGLAVHNVEKQEKFCIPFTAVESAKSIRRLFHLTYLDEQQASKNLVVKFSTHRIAGSLYRALTEKHAFYSCETVRTAVTTQFIRDLKGTIVSIFNEGTELGKKYVFDIQRTVREVYDNSRRMLHQRGIEIKHYVAENNCDETTESASEVNDKVDRKIQEALSCKICMDAKIDSMFSPCGHVSCHECAKKCERCPLCRSDITNLNKIFLPTVVKA